jgi:hypothetical protein
MPTLQDDEQNAMATMHVITAIREMIGGQEHAYHFDLAKVEEHLRTAERYAEQAMRPAMRSTPEPKAPIPGELEDVLLEDVKPRKKRGPISP